MPGLRSGHGVGRAGAVFDPRGHARRHTGEYFALLLLAAAGLMLLVSSDNLLMIFIALELLSVSLYALVAFDKGSPASAEAALKYLLFGGMSAAFTLYGISLIYGITGDLQLGAIAAQLRGQPREPVFYTALVMTLVGFAFKLAAAPFHLWAPDVYEGAPIPVASFVASGSKVASFFVLARILMTAFRGERPRRWIICRGGRRCWRCWRRFRWWRAMWPRLCKRM
jgi:NADH-quinone oxidoreductase subunit N